MGILLVYVFALIFALFALFALLPFCLCPYFKRADGKRAKGQKGKKGTKGKQGKKGKRGKKSKKGRKAKGQTILKNRINTVI